MTSGKGRIIQYEGEIPLLPIPNINYAKLFLKEFSKYPDQTALVDGKTGKSYTYGDLSRIVPAICNGLAASGVRFGDSVILITTNHIDMPSTILGIMLLGATCVPINQSSTTEELKHIIQVSKARWAVANKRAAPRIEDAFGTVSPDALRHLWVIGDPMPAKSSLNDLMTSTSPEPVNSKSPFDAATTVALMPFSSGTTGLPKGVMLSHKNLITSQIIRLFRAIQSPGPTLNFLESVLIVIPMYHMMGFNMTVSTLFSGGKNVILEKFAPKEFFAAIETYKVTYAPVVPYIMRFLERSPILKNYDLSSLLLFVFGSEPVTAKTMETLVQKTGKMTLQGYGMTESSGIGCGNMPTGPTDANCVGKFAPYFQAKVVDPTTGEVLGEGQDGEICMKGPSIMLGYANNPKATAETIDIEGWLHSGDLGHFDEDDHFYITGRMKELIKVKGYQVAPAELENIIKEIDCVGEVAVIGVPHDRLGEAPRAYVIPAAGDADIDTKAIIEHVASRVASYKQLAGGVEVVRTIPKNHIGKIMRKQLRKTYDEEALKSKL